jgi:hypothetical protein
VRNSDGRRTYGEGASGTGVWDRHMVQPVMGCGAVGHDATSDERATRPAMGRRAVEHSAVANERAMGEWARIMSGHAALGPADKHKGDRGGWTDKHEGVGDFVFFCLGPLLGSRVRTGVTDIRSSWIISVILTCLINDVTILNE